MVALCEYELAPFLDEAAVALVQGVLAIRVHDSTADYTDRQPGVARIDPVTYAYLCQFPRSDSRTETAAPFAGRRTILWGASETLPSHSSLS
jgi:hypothetical protein